MTSSFAALITAAEDLLKTGVSFHPGPENVEHELANMRAFVLAADRFINDKLDGIEIAVDSPAFDADDHRNALIDVFDGNVAPPIQVEADRIRERREARDRRYDAIYNADVMRAA